MQLNAQLEALFPFDANRLVQNQKDAVKKCEVIYKLSK
jgi:hypothetical protein